MATWAAGVVVASLGLVALPAQAQVGPLANTAVGNARVIVPDGSSLLQNIGGGETRWFVFGTEPGKTYAVEVVDPYSDLASNTIGAVNVTDGSGVSAPAETNVDCTANARAPALVVASDGIRCIVRVFPPTVGNTQNKRGIYVAVGTVAGPSFQIRVRESTIYGRWTTNGYDFHVELENTTADALCAQILFLPNAGDSYSGTWSGGLMQTTLTIPAFGANKFVFPNGTLVGALNDNKGTLRIGACRDAGEFRAECVAREHVCVQPGDGQVSVLLHQHGEQRRDQQQLVAVSGAPARSARRRNLRSGGLVAFCGVQGPLSGGSGTMPDGECERGGISA